MRTLPAALATTVAATAVVATALLPGLAGASSHREAPLISQGPVADDTDLYAFVSPDRPDTVTIAVNSWPFELPYGGPNYFHFGDDVLYEIHVDNNGDAEDDITYQFRFKTSVQNPNTFLYNTGPIKSLDDPNFNVRQTYDVARIDHHADGTASTTMLGSGIPTPPVNIGPKSTPDYDLLAGQAVQPLSDGSKVFAGQRADSFFVDISSLFDLLTIRKLPGNEGGGSNSLARFNVQTMALQIPMARLTHNGAAPGGMDDPNAIIGVWTSTSRQAMRVLPGQAAADTGGDWHQVSRLGMPLVNEVVAPLGAKDLFNASNPRDDAQFLAAVTDPEPARLLHALYQIDVPPTPRNDLVTIFLTGIPGLNQPANVKPSEMLRLNMAVPVSAEPNWHGVLGGDTQGFPNGRRLGDDVTDIELQAVAGGTPFTPDFNKAPNNQLGDGVDGPDQPYMPVFPYVSTPHQGYAVGTERLDAGITGDLHPGAITPEQQQGGNDTP